MSGAASDIDRAFEDFPTLDPEFPPGHISFKFLAGTDDVFGHAWVAPGESPKGTVLISPQTWGGDSLESVILPLLRCGINAITYVPRGMWDRSQPTYSMYSAVDDLHALIAFVRSRRFAESAVGPPMRNFRRRLDPDRIALFGLSGGGANVSFAACAESKHVHHAVAVAPANLDQGIHPDNFQSIRDVYEAVGRPWFADAAMAMYPEKVERLSIIKQAPRLAPKHLLLVGASSDPLESRHLPLVKALRDAGCDHLTDVVLETDHMFLSKRNALARLLISWLRSEASF